VQSHLPARTEMVGQTIIGAALEVHRQLGPGLLESLYEEALCLELQHAGLRFERQRCVPVEYRGVRLGAALRLDLLVEDCVVVEVKAVEEVLPVHEAQLLSYLRLTRHDLGLLINFNVDLLKHGVRRKVRAFAQPKRADERTPEKTS